MMPKNRSKKHKPDTKEEYENTNGDSSAAQTSGNHRRGGSM